MGRKKKEKFAENLTFKSLIQYDYTNAKNLIDDYIGGESITLELGCGKGEYTLALAKKYPNRKFLGVDIQGERLWKGAKEVDEQSIQNAKFFRVNIEKITQYIPKESVEEIWLTFPDPFPKNRNAKKRLVSENFLPKYMAIGKSNLRIHLKTDSELLYNYTLEILQRKKITPELLSDNVHEDEKLVDSDVVGIKTYFERKHLLAGRKIHYIRFILK
ncbi:MAG TPA: tRNA (guanosine(46)-N7)-methyltransferase TrmB [bacterium]|nr:tRNA (guanosine(46)-N7)-methyltransferase TrmB [bacterium]